MKKLRSGRWTYSPMVTGLVLGGGTPGTQVCSDSRAEAPTCIPGSHQFHLSHGHSTCQGWGSGRCQRLVPPESCTVCHQLQLPSVSNQILWFCSLLSPVHTNQRGGEKKMSIICEGLPESNTSVFSLFLELRASGWGCDRTAHCEKENRALPCCKELPGVPIKQGEMEA